MFQLSEKEREVESKWLKKHNKTCIFKNPDKQGAIGGRISYIFTPTSLGVLTKIKCACGEQIDITDVSDW